MESKSVAILSGSPTPVICMQSIWSLVLKPQLCLHWPAVLVDVGACSSPQATTALWSSHVAHQHLTSLTMMLWLQLMASALSHALLHLKVLHLLLVIPIFSGVKQLRWQRLPKSHYLGPGGSVHLGCPSRVCLGADGDSKPKVPTLGHFSFEQKTDSGSRTRSGQPAPCLFVNEPKQKQGRSISSNRIKGCCHMQGFIS